MSSNPAVSLFAEIKARFDAGSGKAAVDQVKQALGGAKLTIPVTLPANLSQTLNAELAKVQAQIKPLVIPVVYGMPSGGPGGGGPGGGAPWGAASPNWGMYFGQIQQQLQMMTPTASPNWGGGGGGGGGGNNLPQYLRGFGRAASAYYGVRQLFHLQHTQEQYGREMALAGGDFDAQTRATLAQRERLFDTGIPGGLVRYGSDESGYGAENVLANLEEAKAARQAGDVRYQSGISTIAAVAQARIASTAEGPERMRATSSEKLRQAREHSRQQAETESESVESSVQRRRANLKRKLDQYEKADHLLPYTSIDEDNINKSLGVGSAREGRAKIDAELAALDAEQVQGRKGVARRQAARDTAAEQEDRIRQAEANAVAVERTQLTAATRLQIGGRGLDAMAVRNRAEMDKLLAGPHDQAAVDAMQARQELEYGHAATEQQITISGMRGQARGIGLRLSGDTDRALREELRTHQSAEEARLKMSDAAGLEEYTRAGGLKEQQKAELEDGIRRRREKAAAESAQRIIDIEGKADEDVARAKNEHYAATTAALKRSIDDRVNALLREEKAEKDTTKAAQLHAEADAARAAGVRQLGAVDIAANRTNRLAEQRSGDEADVGALRRGGQTDAAARERIWREADEEIAKLDPSDPHDADQVSRIRRRATEQTADLDHAKTLRGRDIDSATADASAHAVGQRGVGPALDLVNEVRDMERNAETDADRSRVRKYRNARVAEMRQAMKPKSHVFDSADFHDAIQASISSGQGTRAALQILDNFDKTAGALPGGGGRDVPNAAAENNKVLTEIRDLMKRSRVIIAGM